MFCITSGTQNYTLKAQNETHRQRWITNLELAKTQARQNKEATRVYNNRNNSASGTMSTGGVSSTVNQSSTSLNSSQSSHPIQPLSSNLSGSPSFQPNFTSTKHNFDEVSLSSIESFEEYDPKNEVDSGDMRSALSDLKTAYDSLKTDPKNRSENLQNYYIKSKEMYKLSVAFEQHQKSLLDKERKKREEIQHRLEELATQHLNFERKVAVKGNKNDGAGDARFENLDHLEEATIVGSEHDVVNLGTGSNTLSEGDEDEFEDALSDGFEFEDVGNDVESGDVPNFQTKIEKNEEKLEVQVAGQSIESSLYTSCHENLKLETGTISPEIIKIITRQRRKTIMPRAAHSLNLWNLIKNFVGQDLSRIPMPVNFNEPLSMIQRFAEGMEYYSLLDKAATVSDPCEQMLYVLAFSMSPYSTTRMRINKPFNPLLGETFEVDRYYEKEGYRLIVEQTSHHPPAASMFVESRKGWNSWNHTTVTSKFRGNLLSVTPIGLQHVYFENNKQHYSFDRITTTAHNIIVGKLWMDQSGEQTCWNHTSKDKCVLKYHPYSYFSRDPPRRVSGLVQQSGCTQKKSSKPKARYVVTGDWDSKMQYREIQGEQKGKSKSGQPQYKTSQPVDIFKKTGLSNDAHKYYHFTDLAFELNEPEKGVAPTDSRHRPDQRLMEVSKWDEANSVKQLLEEAQRVRRRGREGKAKLAIESGVEPSSYKSVWFRKLSEISIEDRDKFYDMSMDAKRDWGALATGGDNAQIVDDHIFTGEYWKRKADQNWSEQCQVDIFEIDRTDAELSQLVDQVQNTAKSQAVPASPIVKQK